MQTARISLAKYVSLVGRVPMQVETNIYNKICIAGGLGANANCKNIYDEI